ncbi:hypothetical protein V1507DRAFT_500289 [Lipomyces tetrasporus]
MSIAKETRCSCAIRTRFLLPCCHQIVLGQPIGVGFIHPRWLVQPTLPVTNIPLQDIDSTVLSVLRDPSLTHEKGTKAEKVQKAADRIEKVRRCKSCGKVGHNRRTYRVNEDDQDFLLGDEEDVEFEEMWAEALSTFC